MSHVVRRLLLTIFLCAFATACQRPKSGVVSRMVIQAPPAHNTLNKTGGVGAMSAMPSDRKTCYGVNVTGPGITNLPSATCGFSAGLLGGFVEPGGTIEVQVPRGTKRLVELYVFLEPAGQNVPCPKLMGAMTPTQLVQTFLVGSEANVDMSADETTVEITASFPGLTHHIAEQLALPATCTAGAAPANAPTGFHISNDQRTALGSGMKLIGSVGRPVPHGTATGSGMKLVTE